MTTALTALESISLEKMIAGPFIAANQAQAELTNTTIKFLQAFAFVKDASGNNTDEVQTFTMSSYVDLDPSGVDAQGNPIIPQTKRQLTLPLIAMLNVPALQIQKIVVDLTLKVSSQTTQAAQSTLGVGVNASVSGSYGFNVGFSRANLAASLSTSVQMSNSSQNSSDVSSSAKYVLHIEAENKLPPGFAVLMEFCTKSDIAPNRSIDTTGKPLTNLG